MKRFGILSLVFISFIVPWHALASDRQETYSDEKVLTKVDEFIASEEEVTRCQETWDILWSEAKAGNLSARKKLFEVSMPAASSMAMIFFPGRSGDVVSRMRDAFIMGAYSEGVNLEKYPFVGEYYPQILGLAKILLIEKSLYQKYSACLLKNPGECSHFLLKGENPAIPEFDDYSKEIDGLLNQGFKPQCFFGRGIYAFTISNSVAADSRIHRIRRSYYSARYA